jgi:predicted transcriptional regulator of viral defense system
MHMKFEQLKRLEKLPYFSITGFKQALDLDESDARQVRENLSRWVRQGHLIRLKKGVYMTRRFYLLHQEKAAFRPAVSAIIKPQSYLSLDYVLQRAGILTEAVYPVTAVTIKNSSQVENLLGTFTYRHIKPELYTGFSQEEFMGVIFHRASVAKALFDYFYFRPLPRALRTQEINLAEELRLNLDELPRQARDEFREYIELSDSPKMTFIDENLRRTVWRP